MFQVHNIAIRYLYTLQNDHHDKSSYHLSLHKDIALLLTRFPVLYNTSPWLVCFITESLYFLISFTYCTQSSTPLPSGNHQFILGIYDSVSIFFSFFFSIVVWGLSFIVYVSSIFCVSVCVCIYIYIYIYIYVNLSWWCLSSSIC